MKGTKQIDKNSLYAALKLIQQLYFDGHITEDEYTGILSENIDFDEFENYTEFFDSTNAA